MPNYTAVSTMVNHYLLSIPEFTELLGWIPGEVEPIYPGQEPRDSAEPFLIYRVRESTDSDMWWCRHAEFSYSIYTSSALTSEKIRQVMIEALGRMDEIEADIEAWKTATGSTGWRVQAGRLVNSITPTPADAEGARLPSIIVFRLAYVPEPSAAKQYKGIK